MVSLLVLAGCAAHKPPVVTASRTTHTRVTHSHLLRQGRLAASAPKNVTQDLIAEAQRELLAGTPNSKERALVLYRKAADRGSGLAQYNLGFCHETGLGGPVDLAAASYWYRTAAANGRDPAVQQIAAASLATLTQTAANEAP